MADERPLLLKPKDAAKALSMCERKLWQMTRDGKIPHLKIGRSVRYSLATLEAFISENEK